MFAKVLLKIFIIRKMNTKYFYGFVIRYFVNYFRKTLHLKMSVKVSESLKNFDQP